MALFLSDVLHLTCYSMHDLDFTLNQVLLSIDGYLGFKSYPQIVSLKNVWREVTYGHGLEDFNVQKFCKLVFCYYQFYHKELYFLVNVQKFACRRRGS